LDNPWIEPRQRKEAFLLSRTFTKALGPSQFPIPWVPEFFTGGGEVDTRLRLGTLPQNVHTGPVALPVSYPMGTRVLHRWRVKLTLA